MKVKIARDHGKTWDAATVDASPACKVGGAASPEEAMGKLIRCFPLRFDLVIDWDNREC